MKRDEKRRKFHENLLKIFYPPHQDVKEEEEEAVITVHEASDLDFIPDVSRDSEEEDSPSNTSKCESSKLTRAQRKRLRRKKLKEAASCRRKFIGPLLPSNDGSEGVHIDDESSAPRNDDNAAAAVGLDQGIGEPGSYAMGESSASNALSKLRRRRMAKRIKTKNGEERQSSDGNGGNIGYSDNVED